MDFGSQCPWNESTLLAFLIRHLPVSGNDDNGRRTAGRRSQFQAMLPWRWCSRSRWRGEHHAGAPAVSTSSEHHAGAPAVKAGFPGLARFSQFWPEALLAFLQLQKAHCFLSCLVVPAVSATFPFWPLRNQHYVLFDRLPCSGVADLTALPQPEQRAGCSPQCDCVCTSGHHAGWLCFGSLWSL